jgi:2-keto-4-pentenoate hydratase/2-oxohepta-3-ene-1,7-dioic acid hydratase in catechol pathway
MTHWIRFSHGDRIRFGTLDGDGTIEVHNGDMFETPEPSGEKLDVGSVRILPPCVPGKMICLWNNFAANAAKQNLSKPSEPLWFLKASSAFLAHGEAIRRPASYNGKIVYEGELGIVIGKRCSDASEDEAASAIFGYTCVNDVTAIDLLNKDPSFAQWVRSKSFDTFGAFGPVIATGLDPMTLSVRTTLNGVERQNYPVSDMFFPPAQLVSLLSRDVTLMPGDVIACGTSVGVGVMSKPENTVEISIDGIGTLSNSLTQVVPSAVAPG